MRIGLMIEVLQTPALPLGYAIICVCISLQKPSQRMSHTRIHHLGVKTHNRFPGKLYAIREVVNILPQRPGESQRKQALFEEISKLDLEKRR